MRLSAREGISIFTNQRKEQGMAAGFTSAANPFKLHNRIR